MQDRVPPVSTERPAVIRTVILLLWVSLGVSVLRATTYFASMTPGKLVDLLFLLCRYIILIMLFWKIGQGREWARVSFLVFFLFRVWPVWPYLFIGWRTILSYSPSGKLIFVYFGLQAAALLLLFTSPGKEWFQSRPRLTHDLRSISQ